MSLYGYTNTLVNIRKWFQCSYVDTTGKCMDPPVFRTQLVSMTFFFYIPIVHPHLAALECCSPSHMIGMRNTGRGRCGVAVGGAVGCMDVACLTHRAAVSSPGGAAQCNSWTAEAEVRCPGGQAPSPCCPSSGAGPPCCRGTHMHTAKEV